MTHTYAILDVSRATYLEIRQKLDAAGYQHAFHEESHGADRDLKCEVIDMHGIAIRAIDGPAETLSEDAAADLILAAYRKAIQDGHLTVDSAAVHGALRLLASPSKDRTMPPTPVMDQIHAAYQDAIRDECSTQAANAVIRYALERLAVGSKQGVGDPADARPSGGTPGEETAPPPNKRKE